MLGSSIMDCRWNYLLLLVLIISSLLGACGPAVPTVEVTIRADLPTPTLEPTFTASPRPTATPRPSRTATPAQSTPTPIRQSVLSGRILDQDTDQPIAGAKVRVGAVAATTDAEGRYTLTGLPPGQYFLSVTHPDYDPGLSSIFALAAGQEQSLDLVLYAPDTSPYPKDPMLTNPLDPNGAPTAEDAEHLARLQGLTGKVVGIREIKLSGEYLVNYRIGDEVRAAVAELNHAVWELTDDAGRPWWIIKVCGNLASLLPAEVAVATPAPRDMARFAEVVVDELIVRECASEKCAEIGTAQQGVRVEVIGCLADGGWCQVSLSDGRGGWCTGRSLRQLAVAEAVSVVEPVLPTAMSEVVTAGEGKIAFVSNRDGNLEIYVMNADGSGQKRLTDDRAYDGDPVWSPDGKQIAFVSQRDGDHQIYVMAADGRDQTRLTDSPTVDNDPVWSPDGRRIAFHRTPYGSIDTEIHVMNADGSGQRRLSAYPAHDLYATWSPDGQRIAFVSHRNFDSEIQVMKVDEGVPTPLTNGFAVSTGPDWSPSGGQIAFSSRRDGNSEIYVINADGSGLTRLTDHPAEDLSPIWSPDGRQIAFLSHRDSDPSSGSYRTDIYVINPDGSSLVHLTQQTEGGYDPTWSPDSRQIAFVSTRDGNSEIYVVNADGSGVAPLTDHPAMDVSPAWWHQQTGAPR
jgi:Tol biopolymer transport system component